MFASGNYAISSLNNNVLERMIYLAVLSGSNTFGAYLSDILASKHIERKQFASLLKINRSQLYRFLNNEQLPDRELLNKIISTLNLRLSEQEKIIEQYECTLYGWEVVDGRKVISSILQDLLDNRNRELLTISYPLKDASLFQFKNNTYVIPINGEKEVLKILFSMLNVAREAIPPLQVRMMINPDCEGLLSLLSSILYDINAKDKNDISINHIIRFKEIAQPKNQLFNLKMLHRLIPLSFFENIYKVYYSEGNSDTSQNVAFFPNYISIDDKNAFLISSDLKSGLYYGNCSSDCIKLLNNEYDRMLNDCLPLFINFHHPQEQFHYVSHFEAQSDTYLLHPEPGFYTLPIGLIENKSVESGFESVGDITLLTRAKTFRKKLKTNKFTEIISPLKLDSFVNTGDVYINTHLNFSIQERIDSLESLLDFIENEKKYSLYLMKEDNPFYNYDSAVYTIGKELLLVIPSYTDYKVSDNIVIRERGIIEGFVDYFNSFFTNENCITDQKAVASIIRKKLSFLQTT